MTGLIITVAAIGIVILSGYFLTKWEKAVFPGNQQNGNDAENTANPKK